MTKLYLEIGQDLEITINEEIKNFLPMAVCGCNQPPRDYVAAVQWKQGENNDSVLVFISQALDKNLILNKVMDFLEIQKSIAGVREKLKSSYRLKL